MPATWIEVADTAVKIGLGALISAIGALLLASQTHSKTVARDSITRKTRMLEEACSDAQVYFSWVTMLLNYVGSWTGDEPRDQTEFEKKFVTDLHATFAAALEARNSATAKVSLLGAHTTLRHLDEYNSVQMDFRKIVARNERLPTTTEFDQFFTRFQNSKQNFFGEANAFLERLNR